MRLVRFSRMLSSKRQRGGAFEDHDPPHPTPHREGSLIWGYPPIRCQDLERECNASSLADNSGTPLGDVPLPDFSALQIQSTMDMSQETYAQTRRANVQTLHQMFPDLDEEVAEAVLEGCGDDLGVAIDRLLEM